MLDAVQAPAFCRLGRAAALRVRVVAAAGFLVGHADDGLARCDGGQPAAAHGVAAGVQQRRTHDGAGNDRFGHQPAAQFHMHRQQAGRHFAKAAEVLRDGQAQHAQFGQRAPGLGVQLAVRLTGAALGIRPCLVDQAAQAVGQHALFFGVDEIHACLPVGLRVGGPTGPAPGGR
ncbi:hypothetical protein G6F22_017451 [Rhizopus arrhizus]|nr:hypothetical protein G6F22_017451 [Rhizopus arrhizus]